MTAQDLLPSPISAEEARLAKQLVEDLVEFGGERHSVLQTEFWTRTCEALLESAATGDARYFMRWEPIAATMVHRTTLTSVAAFRKLRGAADWNTVWRPALAHPNVGKAPPFLPAPWTSAITVQHASHLLFFREFAGTDLIDAEAILDFGPGYGSMCRLAKSRGFTGDYLSFDQPPILAIQRYFLARHGIDALYGEIHPSSRVALCRGLDRISDLIPPKARVAIISTWALSEMPIEVRMQIEPFLARADRVLLAYQTEFSGIDNCAYFSALAATLGTHMRVHHAEISHHPRNFYLFAMS